MRKIILIGGAILVVASLYFLTNLDETQNLKYHTGTIWFGINETDKLIVDIANTEEKRTRGLSYRKSLDEDRGMLFQFDQEAPHTFWMKDMHFPIDIIWIVRGKVVGIEENVPSPDPATPLNELPTYSPPEPVDTVLETNAGWAKEQSVAIGDSFSLQPDLD